MNLSIIIISSLLIFINLILWIVFAVKFRKVFSSEKIINEVREELNLMMADINRNAERNVNLIDDRIKTCKQVTAEADRHMNLLFKELDKRAAQENIHNSIEETKNLSKKNAKVQPKLTGNKNADKYVREQAQGELFVSSKELDQNSADDVEVDFSQIQEKTKIDKHKNMEGIEIPVISSDMYLSEHPVTIKKSFNKQVKELYRQGESVESIAKILGRSIQEVQFVLEF